MKSSANCLTFMLMFALFPTPVITIHITNNALSGDVMLLPNQQTIFNRDRKIQKQRNIIAVW